MPKVTNLEAVRNKLVKLKVGALQQRAMVQVGYTQNYALWVHEVPATHEEGKTDKYLEIPARRLRNVLAELVRSTYRKTGSLRKGLIVAGLRLQRESQELVPIDTGALKASAYTAYEEDAPAVAAVAFNQSQSIRQREMARRERKALKVSTAQRKKWTKKKQSEQKKKLKTLYRKLKKKRKK